MTPVVWLTAAAGRRKGWAVDHQRLCNAIIDAVGSVCSQHGPLQFSRGGTDGGGRRPVDAISATIGFSQGLRGSLTLSFTRELAEYLARSWCGVSDPAAAPGLLRDTVGEITNLISAAAIAGFDRDGLLIDITTPEVVTGEQRETAEAGAAPLTVQLVSPRGDLEIKLLIEEGN